MHIEQQWDENVLTVEGHLMHDAVHDSESSEKRGELILSRGMPVKSDKYRISGVCDMVELIRDDENGVNISGRDGKYRIFPVEYKHGRPDDADAWHLCAQVLCLEEMFVTDITQGAVYYGELRRRTPYDITPELRSEVIKAIGEMNELMRRGHTPRVRTSKKCTNCSMREICQPKLLSSGSARKYITERLGEE